MTKKVKVQVTDTTITRKAHIRLGEIPTPGTAGAEEERVTTAEQYIREAAECDEAINEAHRKLDAIAEKAKAAAVAEHEQVEDLMDQDGNREWFTTMYWLMPDTSVVSWCQEFYNLDWLTKEEMLEGHEDIAAEFWPDEAEGADAASE